MSDPSFLEVMMYSMFGSHAGTAAMIITILIVIYSVVLLFLPFYVRGILIKTDKIYKLLEKLEKMNDLSKRHV